VPIGFLTERGMPVGISNPLSTFERLL
jgi:hypothetical protein